MTQTIQAKCPHCKNVLRIPSEWLNKSMRCKHCKNTFQAKAKSSPAVQAAAPAPKGKPAAVAVAQPANAAATSVAVGAPPVSPRSDHPFGFDDEDAPVSASDSPAPKRRAKGRGMLVLVVMFFFLFILVASGAGFVIYEVIKRDKQIAKGDRTKSENPIAQPNADNPAADRKGDKDKTTVNKDKDQPPPPSDEAKKDKKKFVPPPRDKAKKDGPPKDLAKKDGGKPNPKFTNDPFPRRALLISVNNYLMFNTVQYGDDQDKTANPDRYPGSSTAILRERLTRPPMNFPATQVIELSDGIPPENKPAKAHSTQKSVLESAITDFVDSSRAQDRIVILFAGHAAFLEDKSYLVPIDGNLQKPESLVPLNWVYDQLAKCKAQQKVLILDVFRFSPSRGFERPSPSSETDGAMPEGFDKDVLNPPPGVQIWCSCQKEQNSVELERGSAFLQALSYAMQGGAGTGISTPTQPIPIEGMVTKVNERLKTLVAAEKRTQVSRLTGKTTEIALYNKEEPLAPPMALKAPTAAGGEAAPYDKINTILAELRAVPPTRETRADRILLDARNLPAFPAKKIDGYKQDGYQDLTDLQKRFTANAEEYAKEFPLRAAYFDALDSLKESSKVKLREVLSKGDTDPKKKAAFLNEQVPQGVSIFKLEQTLARMKEAAEKRESETSKRWHANFDYAEARLLSRLVYLYEYNYTMGQIRNDALPELTAGQNGWRVGVTGQKINVTEKKAKDYAKETKKLWKQIQDEYPDTPWSLLAQRESMTALGLQWRGKSD